jgi:hypothetical protein
MNNNHLTANYINQDKDYMDDFINKTNYQKKDTFPKDFLNKSQVSQSI